MEDQEVSPADTKQRVNARWTRIEKRRINLEKSEADGDAAEAPDSEEEAGPVERKAAECAALIEHLLADAEERVANIKVANDAREVARRFAQLENNKQLLAALETEANLARTKFQTISSQWSVILEMNAPLDIESEMTLQRQRCDDLIEQKDALIEQLKGELKRADETFYDDLNKQVNDIKQLGERIDSQVHLMRGAYRSQLDLIESAIQIERASIIEKNENQWAELNQQRADDEIENTEAKIRQMMEFKEKMDASMVEHREKYRATKIQLESEIQSLCKELQDLKKTCFINNEKIDYTHHILKRREEENLLVKTQQKRRLNRMQDVINELKLKIRNVKKIEAIEKGKSMRELEKLHMSISELQSKSNHFASVNESKYQQVWKMNKEKSLALIKKINKMDKAIHEQILGLNWTEPAEKAFIKQKELPSYKHAIMNSAASSQVEHTISECNSTDSPIDSLDSLVCDSNKILMSRILELIADGSGFLIDDKLWQALSKYEDVSANICKIDNIFNALDIKSAEDINFMYKFFAKHSFCRECEDSEEGGSSSPKMETICQYCGESLQINTSDALESLQHMIHEFVKTEEKKAAEETTVKAAPVSRHLSEKDITAYWQQYGNAFSPQREKLWDNLMVGLSQYLPILQERFKLNEDVTRLRKQNSELKDLLRGRAPTKEVPKQKYLPPLNKKL